MGNFTDRMYNKKPEIPGKDIIRIRVMASVLPTMVMKIDEQRVKRVGDKFIPSQSNIVDHFENLKVLYEAGGMSACQEYYDKIINRKKADVTVRVKEIYRVLPWYEKIWRFIMWITTNRKKTV